MLPGVIDLTVNVDLGLIDVVTDPARIDAGTVIDALDDIEIGRAHV